MYKIALTIFIPLLLCSCLTTSVDKSYQYTPLNKEGILAVEHDTYTFSNITVRKVDIPTQKFIGNSITLSGGRLFSYYRMFKLEPGYYAVLESESRTYPRGYGIYIERACYTRNIQVFEISAGTISVIQAGGSITMSSVNADILKHKLKDYPGITAEIKQPKAIASIATAPPPCLSRNRDVESFKVVKTSS